MNSIFSPEETFSDVGGGGGQGAEPRPPFSLPRPPPPRVMVSRGLDRVRNCASSAASALGVRPGP